MAAKWVCGAECQITAAGATLSPDRKHVPTVSGGTITNESGGRNSGRRWQVASTGTSATFRPYGPSSESVLHARFYLRFETSLPTADCQIVMAPAAAGAWPCLYYKSSDTKLYAAMTTTTGASGVTVVADTWYRIDLKATINANPRTMDVQVDGTACGQASSAVASSTFATTGLRFGVNCDTTTATATISFDDIFVEWGSTAAYPLGAGRVSAISPASDGTHSFSPAGDFIYNGGGSVDPTATDTWQRVDDAPNSTTDYIGIATAVAGEYVEWNVGTLPGTATTINGVEVIGAFHAAGTSACKASLRMVEGGSNVDITSDNDVSNTSVGNITSHQATKPSGGAWTQATLEAVKFRFTSSWTAEDVNPDPYCDAVMMEVDWVESSSTPVTGTDSATESEALTALQANVTRTDSATLSEAILETVAWNTTDTTTVSEAATSSAALTQSDSATASEALTSLSADAVATDSATATDALVWAVAWSPTDGVTLTDTPATHADVTAADSLTLTEVGLAEQGAITITDTDTVTVSEALTALAAATVAVDTTTVTDALTWNVDWAVADSATVTDTESVSSTGGSFINATDTATVSEALTSLTAAWQLADTPTVSDLALIDATGTRDDTLGLTDAVTGLHFDVVASDSLTVTEAIATIPLELVAAEAAALVEGLAWAVDWSAVDVVTVTDTASAVLVLPDVFRGRPRGSVEVNPRCAGTGKVGRVGVTP